MDKEELTKEEQAKAVEYILSKLPKLSVRNFFKFMDEVGIVLTKEEIIAITRDSNSEVPRKEEFVLRGMKWFRLYEQRNRRKLYFGIALGIAFIIWSLILLRQ